MTTPAMLDLTTTQGTFADLLRPLTRDNFREVISQVEQNLSIVQQVFSLLDLRNVDALLQEMLLALTLKMGEILEADRATLFLHDEDKDELWSVVAQSEDSEPIEIRIPDDRGIAGEVAQTKQLVRIPYDFYDDPRSATAQEQERRFGYRTYTMLALPILDQQGKLVAVAQLLNKLCTQDHSVPLKERIDQGGFTESDVELFKQFVPSILLILELSHTLYRVSQQQRAADAVMKAVQALSQSSLDLEDTLKRVMQEAKNLLDSDKATLWLLDKEKKELWAKIPLNDGTMRELRIPVGAGYAGSVAVTGKKLNVPFDLYDDPGSETAKRLDQATDYRTCSLLCMPIHNSDGDLIGVTQLVNKRRPGHFPPYDPKDWPTAPECWRTSFQPSDEAFMETFNIQAGVALKNAQLFAKVKQQELMQRDILRNLSNAVIACDVNGVVLAANQSANKVLGIEEKLKGKQLAELIQINEGQFEEWFEIALRGATEEERHQFYPDRRLISQSGREHSVDLTLSTMVDYLDPKLSRGALVVLDDVSDEKRLKTTMYRYMSQELAEELLKLEDAGLGGDRKNVSILFSDIRSYTALTESLEAEEVVHMLNEYFELMVEEIFIHKGTLDKFIGDAIMAVFGSPMPVEDHEWKCVQTAIAMRLRLVELNVRREREGLPPLKIGIGINSDIVISGNIGSSKRMEFTAIGDGVNLASRLEGVTKMYGCDVIISDRTYEQCKEKVHARELDYVRVKGRNQPVAIYEVVGLKEGPNAISLTSEKQEMLGHYEKARSLYLKGRFAKALKELQTVLKIDPHDQAANLFVERCQHWLENPPPELWDGVWTLTEK